MLSKRLWKSVSTPQFTKTAPYLHRGVWSSTRLADGDLRNIRNTFDLKNQNFIVTGGGRGIGFAATRSIAEMGGNVCVLDMLPQPVSDFHQLSSEFKVNSTYIKTDITEETDLSAAFGRAVDEMGSIDGLVTAAGIALDKPFFDYTWEETRKILDVNVTGTFFAVQHAAKRMMEQGTGGSIVLISSICGTTTAPGHNLSAYHASKGAVKMLNTALSVELARHNIRVNSVSPGYIESDMTRRLRDELPDLVKLMDTAPPLKRIGNRNDLTGAIVYLLSDASTYTTGADIMVTGGMHAGRSG